MLRENNIKSKQGFTIIEVVLVLAVAGLIFLMVFIALPALQRSQRDTQRRQDLSRVSSSLVQYQTNNSTKTNNLPGAKAGDDGTSKCPSSLELKSSPEACSFIRQYLNSATATENTFLDPSGEPYALGIIHNISAFDSAGTLTIGEGSEKTTTLTCVDNGDCEISDYEFNEHAIFIVPGGLCDGEKIKKGERRSYAVIMKLEGAGYACLDNHS